MNTDAIKAKRDMLAGKVQDLLGWDPSTYMEYQLDCGFDYLRYQVCVDEEIVHMLTTGAGLFWPWWRNAWMDADEKFLAEYAHIVTPTPQQRIQLLEIYRDLHNIHNVKLFPSKTIFESYVKEVVK